MEQVRVRPAPRESSPTDPAEWNITEDGYRFKEGDQVYNYYDGEWVEVMSDPLIPDARGWFMVRKVGGTSLYTLNSVRVSAVYPGS